LPESIAYDRAEAEARAALGQEQYDRAWAEGRELRPEDVMTAVETVLTAASTRGEREESVSGARNGVDDDR
jgi:hypothetical protein